MSTKSKLSKFEINNNLFFSGINFKIFSCSILVICSLFLLAETFWKLKESNKNKEQSTNIEQLNILRYIPENSKLLFISNLDSFHIVNNNEKDKNSTNRDDFVLIKDSILDYLGIDPVSYTHLTLPTTLVV